MPAKYTKTYTSEAEYMYDQAVSTDLFDQTTYEEMAKLGRAEDFTYGLAGTKTRKSDTFDKSEYDLLHGEDKLDYLLLEYYTEDKTSDEYKSSKEYFNKKIQDAVDEKIYETLNTYERTVGTISGFLGSALNEIVGIAEGLLGVGGFVVEGGFRLAKQTEAADAVRNFIKQDTTGYSRNREAIDSFIKRATYIDKNDVLSVADGVVKSIAQMLPSIVGYVLAPVTGGASIAVGDAIYYLSMAGRGVEEELKTNPNIDYGKLFAYSAISTGIEIGTEKLSAKMFGGNMVDKLFGFGGKGVVQNSLAKTTLSVLTEGEEELIAEMFNSVFYNLLVDPNAPLASMKDLVNAALIGGITGGVMELGGVALSKRYVTTNDGKMMLLKDAKASGLTKKDYKKINKFTTTQLFEDLSNYQEELSQQTELDKLRSKHSNMSDADLQKNYATEYEEAIVKDDTRAKTANEISLKLATLMDKIGVQDFANAVKLLEDTENNRRVRISQYAENLKNDKIGKRIELQGKLEFAAENPGYSISVYNHAELTNNERYILGEIAKMYGKKALFVDYGSKTGNPMENISASKNFVFIEKGLVDKTSSQQVLDTVVKNQLINEIINTPGFLTASDFKNLFDAVMPKNTKYEQLKPQIKQYLLQNVLFDDTCNRRVLRMRFPLFAKLFNKVTKTAYDAANKKFVGTHKPKGFIGEQTKRIAFNTLMKVRKRFLDNARKVIKTQEDAEVCTRTLMLSKTESQKLLTEREEPIALSDRFLVTNKRIGRTQADKAELFAELAHMIRPEFLRDSGVVDFTRIYDPFYYKDEVSRIYRDSVAAKFGISFSQYIWEFIDAFDITIHPISGEIGTKLYWTEVISQEFEKDFTSPITDRATLRRKYQTLDDILNTSAMRDLLWMWDPSEIEITWISDDDPNLCGYMEYSETADGEIFPPRVYLNEKAETTDRIGDVLHELVHVVALDNGGIPTGTNQKDCAVIVDHLTNKQIAELAKKMYGEAVHDFKTVSEFKEKVAFGLYYYNAGEQLARSDKRAMSPDYDSFYLIENYDSITIIGTGSFERIGGTRFKVDVPLREFPRGKRSSEARTLGIQTELAEKGIKNYEEAGFSKEFIGELNTNPKINKSTIRPMIDANEIGTEEATNKIIEYYWPNNKNIKSVKDIKKWLDETKYAKKFNLFEIAYAYYMRHINDVEEDANGNIVSVNKTKTISPKTILLDVVAEKIENGKIYYDKNKINENKALLASAKELLNRENNKNNLVSALLDEDISFTLESIGNFAKKLQKGLVFNDAQKGIDVVADTVSTSSDEEFSLSDVQAAKEWQQQKDSSGERKAEMTAQSLKDNQAKDFTNLLSRVGKNEKGFEELDSMLNIKQRIEDKALGTILSEKGYARLLELYTDPETFIDALMGVYTDENGYAIQNKITKTFKDRLIAFYGEEKYNKIREALKELIPEEKSNSVKTVEKLKTTLKGFKTLSNDEKTMVRGDDYKTFTPKQMQEHIEKLENLVKKHKTQQKMSVEKTEAVVQEQKSVSDIQKEIKKTVSEKTKEQKPVVEPKTKPVEEPKTTHGELDKDTREKAKQQEKTPDKLPSDKNIKNKMAELLSFMGSETASEYQGDFENPVYTEALQKIISKNRSFFDSITADEYQALRQMLLVEETTTADAALNLLIRFAYDNRFSENFNTISELIIKQHKRLATFSGQFLAGLSNTYGHHTVTSFVTEIKQKHGTDVDITEKDVVEMFPEIKSYSSYEDLLRKEIDELSEKQKATKDPFEKNKLRHQIELKTIQLDALLDKDGTSLIDAITQEMLEQDHDQYKTQEKIATAYEHLISKIVQDELNKINNPSVIGKGKFDKIGTGKFFEMLKGLNSFRYLAMLSSPATAIKNGLSNTGVAALSAVSDKVGGWLENKTNWFLKTDTQINFNGEFNETFSEYVEKKYGAKISAETQGSKYTQSQQDKLRQEYAKAKDPLNKSKILSKIKSLEERALSDARWTQPKAMKNLKNMLAGAAPQILLQAEQTLQSMYKEKTFESLLEKIKKTNPDLAALYQDCYSNSDTSLTSTLKLGEELNVQLLDQANKDNIVNVALYRANKTFFKVDNWLTKLRGDLQKTHPGAVALLDFIIPFARTTINTTGFVIDWSPIGVAKGIAKALQTKQMQLSDMANTIEAYYKKEFKNIKQQEIKDNTPQGQEPETYVLSDKEFVEWFDTNAPKDVQQALNGDKKGLVKTYDQMVSDGKIPNGLVLANNPYARAYATEAIANGVVGTAVIALGIILARLVDAFDYEDEDDYLGPIIRIGDMKIALDAMSPFTTMFAIGAMLGSKNIDDKLLTTLEVFADNTVFSIIGSAISYSSNISDFIKNQSITTLQQFVPAIFKTLTKIIDNSKKDKSGSYFEKLIKTTAANMPMFSYLVPNKINPYTGEIEKNYETGILEGITNALLPWGRVEVKSDFEKEAERLENKTDGLAGWFEIDGTKYTLTGQEREVYGKYKAEYIKNKYDAIVSGKEKVTVTTETGDRKTTTYDKLTDKEKQNVLDQIYSSGSSTTRIKYWLDKNNMYITSNYDEYIRLKKQFNTSKIRYNQVWKKSKFVEV